MVTRERGSDVGRRGNGIDRYRMVEARLWSSLALEPRERFIDLEHLGTSVRVLEIGEGPEVVFVHGGSSSGANWAPLVARLDGVRCLLVDRPGCGLSPPLPGDLSDLDRFAAAADRLVADVVSGLGLSSAHVVATSLGGHIALRGAAAHPERITSVVEFGYVPGAPIERVPVSMRMSTVPGLRRLMTAVPPSRPMVHAILRQLGMKAALADGRITREMVDWFHSLLRDTPTLRNEMSMPRELLRGTPDVLPDDVLARVGVPVRFVWGSADPFGGTSVARWFVEKVPGAHLDLWSDVGHAPWMEHPDRAADVVRAAFVET